MKWDSIEKEIIVKYAKQVVLKDFLVQCTFGNKPPKKKNLTDVFLVAATCHGIMPDTRLASEILLKVKDFVNHFLKSIPNYKTQALYYWVIEKNQYRYIEEMVEEDVGESEESFENKINSLFTGMLKSPTGMGLDSELFNELESFVYQFSSEFDLSDIDKYTVLRILERIEQYSTNQDF